MTAKLMLILVTLGLTALALLGYRQQRIDMAHDLTRIHDRCDQVRTDLWTIRCRIAQHVVHLRDQWQEMLDQPLEVVSSQPDTTPESHGG
ncbi:MAG: hypothetical protein MK116_12700 [Phycisphaerales bacterium]|nr:hypothetical protein [Phycisphaerales bacterium]